MMETKPPFSLGYYEYYKAANANIRNWIVQKQGQFGISLHSAQMYAMMYDWREVPSDTGTADFMAGNLWTNNKTKYVIQNRASLTRTFKGLCYTGTEVLINGQPGTLVGGRTDKEKKAKHDNTFYFESFPPGTITPQTDWSDRPEKSYHILSMPAWQITLDRWFAQVYANKVGELVRGVAKVSKTDESQIVYARLTGDVLTVAFDHLVCLADFVDFYKGWTSPSFVMGTKHITTKLLWQPHDLALADWGRSTSPENPYFALVERKGKAVLYYGAESEMTGMVVNMLEDLDMTVWHIGRLWVPEKRYVLGSV